MEVISNTDIDSIKKRLKNSFICTDELIKKLVSSKKIIIVCGPTCTGKSKVGINLAKLINTDIISVDSMQVYKGMYIGTDKCGTEEYGIKQFMIDIFEPDHNLTVVEFINICRDIIQRNFFTRKKVPLLVGGSGLYIKGLINGMDSAPEGNAIVRKMLKEKIKKHGIKKYYFKLKKIDKEYCKKISENDQRRIIRALEVYEITGLPFSDFQNTWKNKKSVYNVILIGLEMERSKLHASIENRVEEMFGRGLVEEVKNLLEKGYKESNSILQAVGYKEVIKYINGKTSLDACIDEVKRNTRRLAKKQMTWFRSEPRINWIRVDNYDNIFTLITDIFKILNENS